VVGIALILVLWVLVLLTIMAGSFVYAVHGSTRLAANIVGAARAQALADGGVERGAFELLASPSDPERWAPDGQPHVIMLAGTPVHVTLRYESGKIDINLAPVPLLISLLRSVGLPVDRATVLAQAIDAWRQPPTQAGLSSAQPDASQRGRFQSIDALQAVPGVTPELFRRLVPLITVYSGQPGVNTAIAPAGVLLALPGADPAQVQAYLAQRRQDWANRQPVPAFPQAGSYGNAQTGASIGVRSEVDLADGVSFVRDAVVQVTGARGNPVNYLAWREGDARSVSAAAPPR
jgi:general secretion pathway protein K